MSINTKEVGDREVNNMTHFVPANEAGRILSYTGDYITKLARDGKVAGRREGRNWLIDVESAKQFKIKNDRDKKERNERVRQERLIEKRNFEKDHETEVVLGVAESAQSALTQTLAILAIGLTIGLGGYAYTTIPTQSANVIDSFSRTLYERISPQQTASTHTALQEEETITTYTSLVIAPETVFTEVRIEEVQSALSDDVSISVDPLNPDTGIIVPHFKDRDGDSYRFLIAPIMP